MTFDNSSRGALFKNTDKQEEREPDYNGSINVDGQDYWLAAWLKTSKKGQKYMSLSVRPKKAKEENAVPQETVSTAKDDLNDDIPW